MIPTRDELIERAAKALAELPGKMSYPQGDAPVAARSASSRGHRPRLDPSSLTVKVRLVATEAVVADADRIRAARGIDSFSALVRTLIREEGVRLARCGEEARMKRDRVRIKPGWMDAGRTGRALGSVALGQDWTLVLWDGEEDPTCFKTAGLDKIRAAAPEPEVDVFEAFDDAYLGREWCIEKHTAGTAARDWFGPLVEAAEADSRLCDCDGHPSVEVDAHRTSCRGQRSRLAMYALRRRATEARS